MPLTHLICETTGEMVTLEECAQCALARTFKECPVTYPYLKAILDDSGRPDFGPTASQLPYCARKWRLQQEFDYAEKPTDFFARFRGNAFHHEVERYAPDGSTAEGRLETLVQLPEGIQTNRFVKTEYGVFAVLSGKPDILYQDGHLVDYKSTARIPDGYAIYTCPETAQVVWEGDYYRYYRAPNFSPCPSCGGKHDAKDIREVLPVQARQQHVTQLAVYAAILKDNGKPVHSAEIVYMDMSSQVRVPVDMPDYDTTVWWMQKRMAEFAALAVPPAKDEPDWECRYCPVNDICKQMQSAEAEIPAEVATPVPA